MLGGRELNPTSFTRDMKELLRQYRSPVWGSKAVLWERLRAAHALHVRDEAFRRETEAAAAQLQDDPRVEVKPLTFPDVAEPTAAERAAHEILHLPYKAWCIHCQRGKGRDVYHRSRSEPERRQLPVIFFDRACTPTSGEDDPAEKVDTFQNQVVVVDSVRSYPYNIALHTEAGALRDGFLVDQMLRYLDMLG